MYELYNELYTKTFFLFELYQDTLFNSEADYSKLIEEKRELNAAYTEFRINQPEIYHGLRERIHLPEFDSFSFLASPIQMVQLPENDYIMYQIYSKLYNKEDDFKNNLLRIYTYLAGKSLQNSKISKEEKSNLKLYLQMISFLFPVIGDSLIFFRSQTNDYPLLKKFLIDENHLLRLKEYLIEDYIILKTKQDSPFMILYKNFIKTGLLTFEIANQMEQIKSEKALYGIEKYYPELEEDFSKIKYLKLRGK